MNITKKLLSIFTATVFVSASVFSMDFRIPNNELTAKSAFVSKGASGGFSAEEIAASPVKPKITLTKKVISADEAGTIQEIEMFVSGANNKYCSTGIDVIFDARIGGLVANQNKLPDAVSQQDLRSMAASYATNHHYRFMTAAAGNYGLDGVLWSFKVKIPDDAKEGDVFPFDIVFYSDSNSETIFKGFRDDDNDKLMQAYTFTQGIYNPEYNNNFKADEADIAKCKALADIAADVDGYIAIADNSESSATDDETHLGDVNDDLSVDLKDVILVRRYIAGGWGVELDEALADVNKDEKVDLKDVILMRRYIAGGWGVELK